MAAVHQRPAALYAQESKNWDDDGSPFTWKRWFAKYFMEGQATDATLRRQAFDSSGDSKENDDEEGGAGTARRVAAQKHADRPKSFLDMHRKAIGLFSPCVLVHVIWWSYMVSNDKFGLFTGRAGANGIPRWYMSVTMVLGSMVAGATSEGGAAVAFPVMTLMFGINPAVARDFSFMIQSIGMSCAAFTILFMGVLVEWKALLYTTLGGVAGIVFGLEYCILDPPYAKMYFVVIWGAFAASLFWLNRIRARKVYLVLDPPHLPAIWNDATLWTLSTQGPGAWVCVNWKAAVLFATGFLGGIFSSISGSGIDICSFAVLTLLFRVSEKTATPTSVILMAINTWVGFLYRQFGQGGVMDDTWGFMLVCAPIVCFGAPFGSLIGSFVHRLVLAWAIYLTDAVQLVAALAIVEPWVKDDSKPGKGTPAHLTGSSAGIFVGGLVFFWLLQVWGQKLMERNGRIETQYARFTRSGTAALIEGPGLGAARAKELQLALRGGSGEREAAGAAGAAAAEGATPPAKEAEALADQGGASSSGDETGLKGGGELTAMF